MQRTLPLAALRRLTATRAVLASRFVAAGVTAVPTAPAMWASQRFAHDGALADATRRELEEELSRNDKPEQPQPPAGWQLAHTPGKCTFQMTKQYEDEQILVHYCPKEDTGDVNHHHINVYITRNNNTMQVDLSVEEGELVLDNICMYDDAKFALDESAEADNKRLQLYPGPKVSELDDNLVEGFIRYLEKRGVNDELGEFVTLYSFWSEQLDYERWLTKINKFVS